MVITMFNSIKGLISGGEKFKIVKVPNNAISLQNVLCHNGDDFGGRDVVYITLNGIVTYKSIKHINIGRKEIGLNNIMRMPIEDKPYMEFVNVLEHSCVPNVLGNINLKLSIFIENNKMLSYHEDNIKEKIIKEFATHYFSNGQVLFFKIGEKTHTLNVKCKHNGMIESNTEIELTTDDPTINLIGKRLLKRDLFKDTFNFEEIGIGGMDKELITIFRRALSTRAIKPSIVENMGIKHVRGLLLYGPPGTGKTLIAGKIGSMISNREPKIIVGPEIKNKWVGGSEENIRKLFEDAILDSAENGINADLHVIIIDELDAICKNRDGSSSSHEDSVVNQLLGMIDGPKQLNNIFIIGMTNRKDMLDEALLRPGRIQVHIEIGLPDVKGREQIFNVHTKKLKTNGMLDKNVNIKMLAERTVNYSGAEIEDIVKNASSKAIHEQLISDKQNIDNKDILVTMRHFEETIGEVKSAFGNLNKNMTVCNKYIHLSELHQMCYEQSIMLFKNSRKINTILVWGDNGTGKTTLVSKIANDSGVGYNKFVSANDMINFDEYGKFKYINKTINNAYISHESIVILDDIDIAINYVKFGNNVSMSTKIYQVLMTILKTTPPKGHKLNLIVTCNDVELFEIIKKHFDMSFVIGNIPNHNIKNVIKHLGYSGEIGDGDIAIKRLLDHV